MRRGGEYRRAISTDARPHRYRRAPPGRAQDGNGTLRRHQGLDRVDARASTPRRRARF